MMDGDGTVGLLRFGATEQERSSRFAAATRTYPLHCALTTRHSAHPATAHFTHAHFAALLLTAGWWFPTHLRMRPPCYLPLPAAPRCRSQLEEVSPLTRY